MNSGHCTARVLQEQNLLGILEIVEKFDSELEFKITDICAIELFLDCHSIFTLISIL